MTKQPLDCALLVTATGLYGAYRTARRTSDRTEY
jgi:hypothetical protein